MGNRGRPLAGSCQGANCSCAPLFRFLRGACCYVRTTDSERLTPRPDSLTSGVSQYHTAPVTLQDQGCGRLLRAGEALRAPGSYGPQQIVGTLLCPRGPRALHTLVTDHMACDRTSHPTRGGLTIEAVPSCT